MFDTKMFIEIIQDIWPMLAIMFTIGIWDILV